MSGLQPFYAGILLRPTNKTHLQNKQYRIILRSSTTDPLCIAPFFESNLHLIHETGWTSMPSTSALLEQEKALQERLKHDSQGKQTMQDKLCDNNVGRLIRLVLLFVMPTDPDSSSDDSDDGEEQDLKELKKAVTAKKTKVASKNHSTNFARRLRANPGHTVLYLGHLPREFSEKELAHFLKQFGRVVHVRLARSRRTGGSKGYGFVQMVNEETARIVADTLSGYILMGQRRLVCHVVPPEKVHAGLFFQFNKEPSQTNKSRPNLALSKIKKVTQELVKRERKRKALMKDAGIEYDFPGFEAGQKAMEDDDNDEGEKNRNDSVVDGKKKLKTSIDESSGKKKRKESMDESSLSAGTKKRSDSMDDSGKKKRSESIDLNSKKARSNSMDSISKKKSKKKKPKESMDASHEKDKEVSVTSLSRKLSDSVDPTIKKKRSGSVDITMKKKRSDSVDSASKKQRKEESEHEDYPPQIKKRKDSTEKSKKRGSAEKPAHKSKKSIKRSK